MISPSLWVAVIITHLPAPLFGLIDSSNKKDEEVPPDKNTTSWGCDTRPFRTSENEKDLIQFIYQAIRIIEEMKCATNGPYSVIAE